MSYTIFYIFLCIIYCNVICLQYGGEIQKMNFLQKFRRNKSGMTGIVIGLVITLVTIGIVLPIGLMVVGQMDTTTDAMDLGATGNETRDALFTNIYVGFDLSNILPLVVAASVIIAAVVGIAYFKQR